MARKFESWGRYAKAEHDIQPVYWIHDGIKRGDSHRFLLPYGNGRSYGDSCLNDGGILLDTSPLNRFIAFDETEGRICCEAGVRLDAILGLIVPRGWFLPVVPGTKHITLGGAIANDVHGKNHHVEGTFGCHVLRLELLRTDGTRLTCSHVQNQEMFQATVGGLGLTGLILWAEIRLKRLESAHIDSETLRFENLEEFFLRSGEMDQQYEYTVAWVDCLSRGHRLGRGLLIGGNHAKDHGGKKPALHTVRRVDIRMDAPSLLLNSLTIKLFNSIFFHKQFRKSIRQRVHYDPFFFPLDAIGDWNRLYGKRGFFQYQCVVPDGAGQTPMFRILETIAESGLGSFLSVMKKFGDRESPGLLSFPRKGVTLALDFPNHGRATLELFEKLDQIVLEVGGAVYPAKDARMSSESFQRFFPQWRSLERWRDPCFSSSFWRRVASKKKDV